MIKFLIGAFFGSVCTAVIFTLSGNPATAAWISLIRTSLSGGLTHAKAQMAVSRFLFDPYSAQFQGLKTVSFNGREYVCGYVNAKNKMGAYIGNHRFVYNTLVDMAWVDDEGDTAKAFKDEFQACLPELIRSSIAKKGPDTKSVEAATQKPEQAELKLENFPTPTSTFAPLAAPQKSTPTDHEKALAAPPPPNKDLEVTPLAWLVSEESSKIDDSKNVFVTVESTETLPGRYGSKGHARITIACREGKTNFWIYFGGHFMSDYQFGTITYRVDKRPAKRRKLTESTDHQALGLWNAAEAIPFVKELYNGSLFFLEATPHSESAVRAEFNIAGLEGALEPLRKACKWPAPINSKSTSKAPISLTPSTR